MSLLEKEKEKKRISKLDNIQEVENEQEILDTLMKISENITSLKEIDERIQFLAKYDDFLKKNKEIIKKEYSGLLSGILKSFPR